MRVWARALTWPKTEHTPETDEDALAYSLEAGLFAVADGVGSASFSGEWARTIVEHFVSEPLLSSEPFEVEWWLRRAQRLYAGRVPVPESLPLFAQEKARQGGASTLITLRISSVTATSAEAEVLACGDSCAILRRAGAAAIESFPLRAAAQFSGSTLALPARARFFSRAFHLCRRWDLTMHPGDTIILATDAVAKAVIGEGAGSTADAFGAVAAATDAEWGSLVRAWRESDILADDDATALVVVLGEGVDELGSTAAPAPSLVCEREAELAAALADMRREGVAVAYGDGSYHAPGRLGRIEAQQARLVADALAAVRAGLMRWLALGGRDVTSLAGLWQHWAALLDCEPSAATLRRSLEQLGMELRPPTWPHVEAFRDAVARSDAGAAAALAPPDSMAHLLTDGERELLIGTSVPPRRQCSPPRRCRQSAPASAGQAPRRGRGCSGDG